MFLFVVNYTKLVLLSIYELYLYQGGREWPISATLNLQFGTLFSGANTDRNQKNS
jgi:hypothetical protein